MAAFYGMVQGQRGEASRLGSHKSGLHTRAASWAGAIVTHLYMAGDQECFEVRMEQHHGKGDYLPIATGKIGDAMSVRTAHRGSYVDMPDADLLALAQSVAGRDVDPERVTFTAAELREFLRQAMAHEELVKP